MLSAFAELIAVLCHLCRAATSKQQVSTVTRRRVRQNATTCATNPTLPLRTGTSLPLIRENVLKNKNSLLLRRGYRDKTGPLLQNAMDGCRSVTAPIDTDHGVQR